MGMHRRGEQKIVAASLLDDLLGSVLTEGAQDFTTMYPSRGFCEAPFTDWEYEVEIDALKQELVRRTSLMPLANNTERPGCG